MSVRARLFLLLLALSVLPMLLLRVNARHSISEMTGDLVRRSQHLLVNKAKSYMLLMVEDHAELWRRETLLLEQTLRLQTSEIEDKLGPVSGGVYPDALNEAYKASAATIGMNILGQITVFENGRVLASNENVRLPRRFDGREARWYELAVRTGGLVWTAPVIDPSTHRIALTVSGPVRDPSGRIVGVTAIMAPLSIGGMGRIHAASISPRLKTYLVDFAHAEAASKGLRVIGQADQGKDMEPGAQMPDHGKMRRMGMMGVTEPVWLKPDDADELDAILSDLKNGQSEVRQAEYETKDFIWAYSPAGVKGLALLLTVPKTDVSADAVKASDYIQRSITTQFRYTFYILLGALLVITLAAWFLSRSVTRPISDLAAAARRLGQGDFSAHVSPAGGREIMELGRAFNQMVHGLAERTRLQEAMELAREVHASLIPTELPQVPGLDMAGVSIACDETGGDAFDVIPQAHGSPGCVAALVGDVSGHGLDAALLMATARAYLRMRAVQPGSPGQVVTDVNRQLSRDTFGTGRFMTLFYLEIDPARKALTYVRAGHDPALHYRAASDDFQDLTGPGLAVGVLEDKVYRDLGHAWPEPGDVLLIGSDGLWEARGESDAMFGKERVRETIRANAHGTARDIVNALLAELAAFRGAAKVEDDVTLLVIKSCNPGATA